MEVQQKEKTLDLAISQIEKQFGQGSIMRMGENTIIKIDLMKHFFSEFCFRKIVSISKYPKKLFFYSCRHGRNCVEKL